MAEPTGIHLARARSMSGWILGGALSIAAAAATAGPPEAAPLPGAEWTDPDSVNWTDSPTAVKPQPDGGRWLGRRLESRADQPSTKPPATGFGGGRLLGRLRSEMRIARGHEDPNAADPEKLGAGGGGLFVTAAQKERDDKMRDEGRREVRALFLTSLSFFSTVVSLPLSLSLTSLSLLPRCLSH